MKMKSIILYILGLVVLLVLSYFFSKEINPAKTTTLPYYSYDKHANSLTISNTPDLKVGPFSFKDHKDRNFTFEILKDKIFVADYFFVSCPGICKMMGTQLQRVYTKFIDNPNVVLVSYTSKPEEDSPEILNDYAKKLKVNKDKKWYFVTGKKTDLYNIARNQFHITNDTGDGGEEDFIHTERFVLVDKKGYIRSYYDGTDSSEVSKLINDIQILQANN